MNKSGAFYTIYGSNGATGLLVAWAWAISRSIDVIEQSDGKGLRTDGFAGAINASSKATDNRLPGATGPRRR
jgi:hypothetical protein